MLRATMVLVTILGALAPAVAADGAPPAVADPGARALAGSVLDAMGGADAWASTRVVRWDFFGRRLLYWDRGTGDVRIEADTDDGSYVVLTNVVDGGGSVWRDGTALEGEELTDWLRRGYEIWINDSYWMFMPYKLLDPGVTLRSVGAGTTEAGAAASVLELTFDGVGVTPRNKYHVLVGDDSGLVEEWAFFADRDDAEPRFRSPWNDWRRFGRILLATDHGRGADWRIAVYDELPAAAFRDPAWSEAD